MSHKHASLLADHPVAPLVAAIGAHAAAAGWRTAVVGGFVRDLLLGIISQDIDIVVEGDAIACARLLAVRLDGAVAKTSRFGTAVLMVGGQRIDLAMARTERYPRPGALPEVSPGTLEDDLWRRDFTINAMAVEISPGAFGALLDPTGGGRDLAARVIRILHAASFRDDPTRLLRALRLAHRLGFTLEGTTAEAFAAAVRGRYWPTVGAHRLSRELRLIFAEPDWPGLLRGFDAHGLYRPLFCASLTEDTFTAFDRVDAAAAWLAGRGLDLDRTAITALIIGGRAAHWLGASAALAEWPSRLAAGGVLDTAAYRPGDIPPPVLAYLWIMCQNEEERARLGSLVKEEN